MADQNEEAKREHPRVLFPHEAHDFTPWLAENLHLLGEELGLSLELVGTEQSVGPYSLDVLAEETATDVFVAIENQLEWTNIHHLGQLLTYTAGCDAQIAIWVAAEFGYEHARALNWLNQWTAGKVSFYGVKIEAVRHPGTSRPEPRFRKVVWPGGWDKGNTPTPGPGPGDEYSQFYRPLVAELMAAGFSDRPPHKRWGNSGRFFRSRRNPGISYAVSLEGANAAFVTLHIETGDKGLTKQVFDNLEADRSQIESNIGVDRELPWHWNRHNRWNYSSISIRTDGSIHDPPEKLEETRMWMLGHLAKFKAFFDPRIKNILQELRQATPTDD